MKKLLGIVVLGLLLSGNVYATHESWFQDWRTYENEKKLDKNKKKLNKMKRKLNNLEGQIEIQNYCQINTEDKIEYQECLCASYEESDVGVYCEKGWEEILEANRKDINEISQNEISDSCKLRFPNDKIAFQSCKCKSYERKDVGIICKGDWRALLQKKSKKKTKRERKKL